MKPLSTMTVKPNLHCLSRQFRLGVGCPPYAQPKKKVLSCLTIGKKPLWDSMPITDLVAISCCIQPKELWFELEGYNPDEFMHNVDGKQYFSEPSVYLLWGFCDKQKSDEHVQKLYDTFLDDGFMRRGFDG